MTMIADDDGMSRVGYPNYNDEEETTVKAQHDAGMRKNA